MINSLWFWFIKKMGHAEHIRIGNEVHEKATWKCFSVVSREVCWFL
jgi:hypothetical protein